MEAHGEEEAAWKAEENSEVRLGEAGAGEEEELVVALLSELEAACGGRAPEEEGERASSWTWSYATSIVQVCAAVIWLEHLAVSPA